MKTIILGDTHGNPIWKKIIEHDNNFDKIVFIGDYVDSRENIAPVEQLHNFKEILDYKKANMDKVTLLLGNHDYHYLNDVTERYSGFQGVLKFDMGLLLENAIKEDLIQVCLVQDRVIYSHAGISEVWCKNNEVDADNLEESINSLLKINVDAFKFTTGRNQSPYGDDIEQSPIWIRPESLSKVKLPGFTHVVGHTTQRKIDLDSLDVPDNIILIDTLNTSREYLTKINRSLAISKIILPGLKLN